MEFMNYILMILGILVALSRYLFPKYDQALLIIGISLLMIGIYRISRNLPSKNEEDFQDPATKIRNPEDEWRFVSLKWDNLQIYKLTN